MTRLLPLLACSLLCLATPAGAQEAPPPEAPREQPLPRTPHAREIRSLVQALGSDDWAKREAARDRLLELGKEAEPYLRRASRDPDPERSSTAQELLETMRWLVPEELRAVVGEALDDFPALPVEQRLQALRSVAQRVQEARPAIPFLITCARFDPEAEVRQAAVGIYLQVTPGGLPGVDGQALEALADEAEGLGVFYFRGELLRRLERRDEAIAAAQAAYALGPDERAVVILLVELLLDAERFQEALPIVRRAEQQAPQDQELRILTGEALLRSGHEDEGLARLSEVLELQGEEGQLPVLLRIGRAFLRSQRPELAVSVYRNALGRFPYSRELNVALGEVYEAQGDLVQALAIYLSEIRYTAPDGPGFAHIKRRLGAILDAGGAGWLQAEDAFFLDAYRGRQVIAVRQRVGEWFHARGLFEQALQELRAVCALSPNSAAAQLRLGDVLRDAGRLSDAAAAYRAAQALAPQAIQPRARLRDLEALQAQGNAGGGQRGEGFAFWEARLEANSLSAVEGAPPAVSEVAPPPLVLGERVLVPVAGGVQIYGLSSEDGAFLWRYLPEPPPREEGVLAEQVGLEPVALVPLASGTIAALDPRRARDPSPVVAVLYNRFWRPAHRSWRKARFRGLLADIIDPDAGQAIARVEVDELLQVVTPSPVAQRGRILALAQRRARRRELELIDMVEQRPLWRSSVPAAVRRPLFAGERLVLAWDRGATALDSHGNSLWTHRREPEDEGAEGPAPFTTAPCRREDAIVLGTGDGRLVELSLADGAPRELARPGQRRLTGALALGRGPGNEELLFAAERGGPVHALRLEEGRATLQWSQPGPKAAFRTLAYAGGCAFGLNGSGDDFFADETAALQAWEPLSGKVLFQRPVARPATLVHGEGLVVVAAGGIGTLGGLRILGASPAQRVDPRTAQLTELRSAAADALAEGELEVSAVIARRYQRAVGSPDLLDDADLAFIVRTLARSKRRDEALDRLHEAEERAELAGASLEPWEALREELGLVEIAPEDEGELEAPEPLGDGAGQGSGSGSGSGSGQGAGSGSGADDGSASGG